MGVHTIIFRPGFTPAGDASDARWRCDRSRRGRGVDLRPKAHMTNIRAVISNSIFRPRRALLLLLPLVLYSAAFAQDPAQALAEFKNAARNAPGPGGGNILFQVSTLDALLQGIYNGSFTVGQLKQQGDFGLGTYEGLDGEMIAVNGHYYTCAPMECSRKLP